MKNNKKSLDAQGKAVLIIELAIFGLAVLFTLFVLFGRLIPELNESSIYKSLDFTASVSGANPWLRSISYIIGISTMAYIIRKALLFVFTRLNRGGALISLIASLIKYVAAILIILLILAAFGVNTTTILAGIGILSLIVGLAVQPLLQDIIAGLFIVFEKTYDVGDVIVVDGFRGTVTEIGIRTTKIKDAGGDIKVINNSDIRTLINMTREMSYAICDVDIEYSESLLRVEKVIADNLDEIKEKIPAIASGPYYKGVVSLGASGVTIRLVAECPENTKFQTQRDLNRQIKLIFDKNNIGIPFTQVVVHSAKEASGKHSDHREDHAHDFVMQQNEMSQGIGEEVHHS